MPNPVNHRCGEQWEACYRCGRPYPLSKLSVQQGSKVCASCFDDTTILRHSQAVQRALESNDQEGVDMRGVDLGFFAGVDVEET